MLRNEFSALVGEEYVQNFSFSGLTLDQALREFLSRLTLEGETQERERVLQHFSRRFVEENAQSFNSEDACHTLTCALMILNTDLHNQSIGHKMTCVEFIENLAGLNDGSDFPREVLKHLYAAVKAHPFEGLQADHHNEEYTKPQPAPSKQNPFLTIPDPEKTTEYIKGYVMRKCIRGPDGKKTAVGKRTWKTFYATLKDMILYLHKDEYGFKKVSSQSRMNNCIHVHHSLAAKASDYSKKPNVFRLQTADWAQYLFETGSSKECQEWIDLINTVAATFSSPPLPAAIGSQRKFVRPLLPSAYTKLNLQQQLSSHTSRVEELEQELRAHRSTIPQKNAVSHKVTYYNEKEHYLLYDISRFGTYRLILESKINTLSRSVSPSSVDQSPTSPDSPVAQSSAANKPINSPSSPQRSAHSVDRHSYHEAIAQNNEFTCKIRL